MNREQEFSSQQYRILFQIMHNLTLCECTFRCTRRWQRAWQSQCQPFVEAGRLNGFLGIINPKLGRVAGGSESVDETWAVAAARAWHSTAEYKTSHAWQFRNSSCVHNNITPDPAARAKERRERERRTDSYGWQEFIQWHFSCVRIYVAPSPEADERA